MRNAFYRSIKINVEGNLKENDINMILDANDDNYVNGYFVYKKNNFYIKDDILYYIDDFKVIKANSKGEKLSFDNTNINALFIFDDKFIYFDDNETLKVKNLIDGELLYDSNVELKNIKGSDEFSYMVNSLNEGFILKYTDNVNIIIMVSCINCFLLIIILIWLCHNQYNIMSRANFI